MTIPASPLLRFGTASLVALLSLCFHAAAAEKPSGPAFLSSQAYDLKVTNGKIAGVTKDGKPLTATLRTVVDILRSEYPTAAITIVGVEDLVIETVTLRVAPRTSALRSALVALVEASGRKFRVQDSGEQDFVLMADRSPVGHRIAEVFNLSPLLSNNRASHLERQLRDAEMNLAATRKVMGNDHGRIKDVTTEIELIKARLAQTSSSPNSTKVIEQIEYTVIVTLKMLRSAEKQPEFQFHEGTNLLIVVGGDDAIEVTRKVVAALEKGAN